MATNFFVTGETKKNSEKKHVLAIHVTIVGLQNEDETRAKIVKRLNDLMEQWYSSYRSS